ncbi:MAG TPA: hypothetical protein VGK27_07605 [Candidatus Deferrimicrobiaceae bacterium]|jgi:hypothetical protein
MVRKCIVFFLVLLSVLASAASADEFLVLRIDGRLLRKSSGKLVTSLSEFELDGQGSVTIENRKTRERMTLKLTSVYDDSSYTETLPAALFDAIDLDAWTPFVNWRIPLTTEALNRRLTAIHEQQNSLRHAMGNALMEDDGGSGKVTSRSTLNKIEKYHRLGNRIAQEIMRNWNREETNPFFFPVRIQVGFNPFGPKAASAQQTPLLQAREVIYWELHRLLTQQYGIDEALVPLIFNAPGTVRTIIPLGELSLEEQLVFSPQLLMSSETLDGAVYLQRQDFVIDLKNTLRTKAYLESFVTDRPVLDAFVNEGKVTAVIGRQLALSFITPYAVTGERLYVVVGSDERDEVPVTIEKIRADEGYSLTASLPEEAIARIRAGMKVHRRK